MTRPYFVCLEKVGCPLKGTFRQQISRLSGCAALALLKLPFTLIDPAHRVKSQRLRSKTFLIQHEKPRNVETWGGSLTLDPVLPGLKKNKAVKSLIWSLCADCWFVHQVSWECQRICGALSTWLLWPHLGIDYSNRTQNYHRSTNLCLVSNMQTRVLNQF